MSKRNLAALAVVAVTAAFTAHGKTADVVVLMDESSSMAGEQAWISGAISSLDGRLVSSDVTDNRYGLVGFGASAAPAPSRTRSFAVGSGQFGSASQFVTAADGLVITGSTEDGWAAISLANTYTFRSGAVRNYILVTDEDRDNTFATTYNTMLESLTSTKTLLNAVIQGRFACGDGSRALGVIGTTGYKANGEGGFTKCSDASFSGSLSSNIHQNYVQLALATGGGAWDLSLLRAGGSSAESFTSAFIDGKVGEIVVQPNPIPEPSTYALMAGGLGVVTWRLRRRRKTGV